MATKTKRSGGLKRWRTAVAWAARVAHRGAPIAGDLALSVTFRTTRPATVKRARPSVKPDLSKLIRALEDALTGIVWVDDSQVVRYDAIEKVYALPGQKPGAHVVVKVLETESAKRREARTKEAA